MKKTIKKKQQKNFDLTWNDMNKRTDVRVDMKHTNNLIVLSILVSVIICLLMIILLVM